MRADKAEAYASAAGAGEGRRNLPGSGADAETRWAAAGETKPEALRLMEAVVERSNMLGAYERVVSNEGAPGVDGVTVAELKPWLKAHWAKVRQALLAGEYMPAAVRKVEIPKPQGGVRTLGIPTVLDRLIQQALHQVTATAVRTRVFRVKLRLSSRPQRAPSGESRKGLCCGRETLGRGPGLGEVLRPGEPRRADGTGGAQGRRQTGTEADPALSASRSDGRRRGERTHRGHPARRTVVPAAVEYSADRSGPGTGETRASLLPLRRRLQHLCRQPAERTAGDGGGHGVSGAATEVEGQRGKNG